MVKTSANQWVYNEVKDNNIKVHEYRLLKL